ncbi:hypothetical protein DSM104329_02109 [Capillimicrobium parvum]|uniref:Glycosyltransferase 2-like domain-containing protein n=1 Tax=Capillimicrobium parvum TaxID=2884022 RepID=A0A9E7C0K7_9ACTN|nr:hypothetical protein DSM104329_02109 [Capillimicrobium parvum]
MRDHSDPRRALTSVGRPWADPRPGDGRPRVDGKFLSAGGRRLWLRGATYGTFATGEDGRDYGSPAQVAADLDAMAASGLNTLRTYSVPPRWLLDQAFERGIWVLVGLPWEQHIAFLDERGRADSIEARVGSGVRECRAHPAVLAFAIGNEIPASIVRWYGRRRIEGFLRRLQQAVKDEDPEALVTYVNFPSTEYLQLGFLDFVAFNVYLEDEAGLDAYLFRLQSVAGERPLVMAEIGLDSRRNGTRRQAQVLSRQLRSAFRAGCAGAVVFSWTDEWHRGGQEILDWDFGVTDRQRRAKPALSAIRDAFAQVPLEPSSDLPRVSVVVCTHNGAATLDDCLRALAELDYPDYEVIVVDDGSTDASAQIAARHPVRLISTINHGLSAARNEGWRAATGEIVAYTDDDAEPDPHWLGYLVAGFAAGDFAAVGGPNVPPPGDGDVAACVANAPGGPVHVLLSDRVAEHIPGCNMAFRREWLEAIGGFDAQFRVAGDDVDVCWRIQEHGGTLGFHPSALVWHHRRATVRRFWRQQRGYGRAEALLERKWPEKYNVAGQLGWGGRLYGRGLLAGLNRSRVYYGVWGSGAFQPSVAVRPNHLFLLAATPEWYLVLLALGATAGLGRFWPPLLLALPLLVAGIGLLLAHAVVGAAGADFRSLELPTRGRRRRRALTALLYLLGPAARLHGRLAHGLAPWRRPKLGGCGLPRRRRVQLWLEEWRSPEDRVGRIEEDLRAAGARVRRGGAFDRWDLEITAGALGGVRMRAAVEEHGQGRQQLLTRSWPYVPRIVAGSVTALVALAVLAGLDGAMHAMALLGAGAAGLAGGWAVECGRAAVAVERAVAGSGSGPPRTAVVTPMRPAIAVDARHGAELDADDAASGVMGTGA